MNDAPDDNLEPDGIDALSQQGGDDPRPGAANTSGSESAAPIESDSPQDGAAEDTAAVGGDSAADQDVSQADIEALMEAAQDDGTPSAEPDAQSSASPSGAVMQSDVDVLLQAAEEGALDSHAASEKAAAVLGPDIPPSASDDASSSPDSGTRTQEYAFADLGASPVDLDAHRVNMLGDVKLNVRIELGRTRMLVEDVLKLDDGSVVELDKVAGDPVDVYVNDRLVARGEVLVLNDNFCVRVSEVFSTDPHRVML